MDYKLLFSFILLFSTTFGFSKVELTKKEKDFLVRNPTIILGTDKDWEPYTILNSNGTITGYDASVLKLINELTGSNFVIKRGKWSELKQEVKDKKIHGLSTGSVSGSGYTYMNFSNPYLKLEKIVFTNSKNKKKIKRIEDLKGKIFAIDKNNLVSSSFARNIEGVKVLETNSAKEAISAVTNGEADVMLGNSAMFYILNKMGNNFIEPAFFAPSKSLFLVFSFRKDLPEAVSIVNKALLEIGLQKLLELKKYWFQESLNEFNEKIDVIYFTKEENAYLKNKKSIKMCIDPSWLPYEKLDKNGKHIGLSSDFFKYFQTLLSSPIELVKTKTWTQSLEFARQRKCDILSLAMETKSRKEYMNFTSDYLDVPMVVATKNEVPFIGDLMQLNGKKIAIEESHAFVDILENKYPKINLIYADSVNYSLQQVANGEIFGFIGSVADIAYSIQNNFLGEIKIAGKFDERLKLSVGVRNDDKVLFSIFEKVVDFIPSNLKQEILNKHIAVKYEQKTDYTLVMRIIIVSLVIILAIIYWNRKLSIAKTKLELAQEDIEKKNKELKILSITDKLTGVYNRAKIDRTIEKELVRTKRYNHHLSIILVDFDFFKNINDTYGHLVGDEVLIHFAKLLENNTRNIDIVGRWGGEEFLIICPETNIDGAVKLAQDLREKVESYTFEKAGKRTASFGLTVSQDFDTLETIVLRADEALYKAKETGRNKVVFF